VLNLLLAEDNLADALVMQEAVRNEGLPVVVYLSADGEEAINFIDRAERDPEAPCPQLVVLDLNLPKVDGFAVLERLRASEKCKDVPVVIVTSSDAPEDISKAAALGAAYFRKPPDYDQFLKLGGVLKQLISARPS
jgi:CheY-like chemotaxis protein